MKRDTILIFEDNSIDREILVELFRSEYKILEAANGKEGIAYLNSHSSSIAVVLLDYMMPVMDGYQALVGIRNLEKERNISEEEAVKVIMTTALNEESNVKMAFELGCTIYSGKPIDQDRFEQALKKLNLI